MIRNPYVGPRTFEESESQFFFGRDEEIEILAGLVMARRAALFFAQSGAGKSSLLRAGLIPELSRQETMGHGRRAITYQKMWVLPILMVGGGIPSQMSQPIANIYVFSALLGVNLTPLRIFKVILVPITVNLAVLASFGPITGFFTLSTDSYPFMKLLNVLFFAVAGLIGLGMLLKLLDSLEAVEESRKKEAGAAGPSGDGEEASPRPVARPRAGEESLFPKGFEARKTFFVWIFLYAVVGAQMGWILRPFIGSPDMDFQIFREREANIFIDVMRTLGEFF